MKHNRQWFGECTDGTILPKDTQKLDRALQPDAARRHIVSHATNHQKGVASFASHRHKAYVDGIIEQDARTHENRQIADARNKWPTTEEQTRKR